MLNVGLKYPTVYEFRQSESGDPMTPMRRGKIPCAIDVFCVFIEVMIMADVANRNIFFFYDRVMRCNRPSDVVTLEYTLKKFGVTWFVSAILETRDLGVFLYS